MNALAKKKKNQPDLALPNRLLLHSLSVISASPLTKLFAMSQRVRDLSISLKQQNETTGSGISRQKWESLETSRTTLDALSTR